MSEQTPPFRSCFKRIFGRSLIRLLFGNFFENKNNAAAIIGIILVLAVCYVVVFRQQYEYMNGVLNVVFVVIGYYFGAKQSGPSKETEEDE